MNISLTFILILAIIMVIIVVTLISLLVSMKKKKSQMIFSKAFKNASEDEIYNKIMSDDFNDKGQ